MTAVGVTAVVSVHAGAGGRVKPVAAFSLGLVQLSLVVLPVRAREETFFLQFTMSHLCLGMCEPPGTTTMAAIKKSCQAPALFLPPKYKKSVGT